MKKLIILISTLIMLSLLACEKPTECVVVQLYSYYTLDDEFIEEVHKKRYFEWAGQSPTHMESSLRWEMVNDSVKVKIRTQITCEGIWED